MKRGLLVGSVLVVVAVLVVMVWLSSTIRYGFSAHDEPTAPEAFVARSMRRWAVPVDLRDMKNPMPHSAELMASARAHWADHCAICHGNDGKGQTAMGQHLYPRAPEMTLPATQSLTDGELFAIIENGIRLTGMPGWGDGTAESARGSWELVHFIRHLPKLTAEEIAEMEKLNPKSPEEFEQMRAEEEFLEGAPESPTDTRPHH